MPIKLQSEELMSLTDVTRNLPKIGGKRLRHATVSRWCRKGCLGVRLEHVRIGGRVCTSREAVARFIERMTAAGVLGPNVTKPNTGKQRARRTADVKAEQAMQESPA